MSTRTENQYHCIDLTESTIIQPSISLLEKKVEKLKELIKIYDKRTVDVIKVLGKYECQEQQEQDFLKQILRLISAVAVKKLSARRRIHKEYKNLKKAITYYKGAIRSAELIIGNHCNTAFDMCTNSFTFFRLIKKIESTITFPLKDDHAQTEKTISPRICRCKTGPTEKEIYIQCLGCQWKYHNKCFSVNSEYFCERCKTDFDNLDLLGKHYASISK